MALEWLWDRIKGLFRREGGEPLDRDRVLGLSAQETGRSMARIQHYTERALAGDIPTAQWEAVMRREVRRGWMQQAILGRGGAIQMTYRDWGMVGGHVGYEYGLIRQFARDMANGRYADTPGAAIARARMYGNGGRRLFFKAELEGRREAGFTEMRRVLGNPKTGLHCDSCVRYAGLNWQPLGTLPMPGDDSECSCNCNCTVEYR